MKPFDEKLFDESKKEYLETRYPGDLGQMADQTCAEPEKIERKASLAGRWISFALAASLLFVLLYWSGLFEATGGGGSNHKVVSVPGTPGNAGRSSLVPGTGTMFFARLRPIKKYSSRQPVFAPSFAMFGPSQVKRETIKTRNRKPVMFPAQKTVYPGRPVHKNRFASTATAFTDTELRKLKQSRKRLLKIQNRSRPGFGFKSKLRS